MIRSLIAVFIGGGAGSVARYAIQRMMHHWIATYSFPWATMTVNIAGSFLIGLFYTLSARFNLSEDIRLLLTAGLCGGFTTFSTFSNDGLALLKSGETWLFAVYTIASVVLGVGAAMAGATVMGGR